MMFEFKKSLTLLYITFSNILENGLMSIKLQLLCTLTTHQTANQIQTLQSKLHVNLDFSSGIPTTPNVVVTIPRAL
jgi:hypothetical protein